MANYQLTAKDAILRTSDGAFIPADPANQDYQDYLVWLKKGHVPDPMPAPSAEPVIAASKQSLLLNQAKAAVAQGDTATALNLLLQHLEG